MYDFFVGLLAGGCVGTLVGFILGAKVILATVRDGLEIAGMASKTVGKALKGGGGKAGIWDVVAAAAPAVIPHLLGKPPAGGKPPG